MRILIIVPDGVGIRNYLYSNFIDYLIKENYEIIIYHKISESAISEIKKQKPNLKQFKEIPFFIENLKARLFRESLAYARLLRNAKLLNNQTILKFWKPNKKGVKKILLYFFSEMLGTILSKSNTLIKLGDKLYESQINKSDNSIIIKKYLKSINPSLVINLHQRSPITAPIITSAKELKIKTATIIFSWDNVPKARLISRYNYYFVWSKLMKSELSKLYPEIQPSKIKITGTPQFEFYFNNKNYLEKKSFFEKYGLEINKKTICFSGNDTSSPYEANYLEDICESIINMDKIKRPQILFRRCPVDKSNRFDELLEKYNEIIFPITPDWYTTSSNKEAFSSIFPTYNDVLLLVNTIKHSDLVINLGSTMAHDSAILDVPCLYLNYNPVSNPKVLVENIYNYQHFKSMKGLEPVGWIRSKEEIKTKIIEGLYNPQKVGKDRKKWLEKIVLHPLSNNSKVLSKKVIECI